MSAYKTKRPMFRDANEKGIVAALEAVGASVTRIDGTGVPDLLVGYRGQTFLLEVKLPAGPRGGLKDRTLNEQQRAWWATWVGAPAAIVRSADEALRAIGIEPVSKADGLVEPVEPAQERDVPAPQ